MTGRLKRFFLASWISLAFPAAAADLMAGAKWEYSIDDGATWNTAPPVVPGGKVVAILARTNFGLPAVSTDEPYHWSRPEWQDGIPDGAVDTVYFGTGAFSSPAMIRRCRALAALIVEPR